ncbi:phage tail tape measure protein [Streptomyces nodosus]|uniref:phage tail tape measure protein n=1 Tax=Streptomyces nodosus TaxID=40318 RepID=UPI0036E8A1DC
MALTVGELLATVSVDDQGVRAGLNRAEQSVRSAGSTMAGDADRAGRQAGTALGDGMATTAVGEIRTAGARIADEGGRIGEQTGTSLRSRLTSSLKVGLAAAGVAAGALLMTGFADAIDQGRVKARLGAQLDATPAEAQKYGKVAGRLYANAITEDFQEAADTVQATMRAGLLPPDATNKQIESISTRLADVANLLEEDVGQTARSVGKMIKTGLAKDATEALDILTRGIQTGGNEAEDLLDTFSEYSTQFRNMGLSGQEAMGLISQGLQAGARDADVVADTIKEFSIEAVAGSDKIRGGYEALGMDADRMFAMIGKGGKSANKALDETLDALRGVKNPTEQNAIAVELFGTKAEDLGQALYSLDPSSAVDTLGQVSGAAGKMGDSLRDNAGVQIDKFKRQALQALTEFIGGTVLPALQGFFGFVNDHKETFVAIASVIAAVVIPAIVALGVQSMIAGAQMAAAWVIGLGPIGWIGLAIGALVVLIVTYWDDIKKYTLQAWDWFVDKLIWAKDMAIKLFLNLTLPGLIFKHWNTIRTTTVTIWNAVVDWLKGIPGRLYQAFTNWSVTKLITQHWTAIKTATVNKATEMVTWVRGLPGRISSAVGSLKNLLYGKGTDVVRGLLNGVKSMGGWLRSQLMSFAKNMIPGPIAKALGIHSPSKVMAREIGRWIPAGVVKGIESGQGALDRVMSNLVTPSAVPAFAGAGGGGFTAPSSGVHIEHWHAAENGSPDDNARALAWLAKARG